MLFAHLCLWILKYEGYGEFCNWHDWTTVAQSMWNAALLHLGCLLVAGQVSVYKLPLHIACGVFEVVNLMLFLQGSPKCGMHL